jgi:hypothetical protein
MKRLETEKTVNSPTFVEMSPAFTSSPTKREKEKWRSNRDKIEEVRQLKKQILEMSMQPEYRMLQ